jgi:hypothetical protein
MLFLLLLCLSLSLSQCGAYDGDTLDATGCPKVFEGKCHCKKQTYHYWKPERESFVVNCTNTRFNRKSSRAEKLLKCMHCL